ncbi:MAG: succinyl-diaminopimelate desuccinylase [Pseudomonadota bacterium]
MVIDPLNLLKSLIAFKSITPSDDSGLDFIAKLLVQHGFEIHLKEFGPDSGFHKVKNLYAVYSPKRSHAQNYFNLCFSGHIDVVPPGPGWASDPFKARQKNGKIYGRGAVDMKGALASMIAAAINFLKNHKGDIKTTISFLITSDEEGEATYGTKAMLQWMEKEGHKIDFAIIGEPTSEKVIGDTIKIGRRGSANFDLEVRGKQGHVAYPHLADNPIPHLVQILNELSLLKLDNGNSAFQPSNIAITSIDVGNPTTNVIPEIASAKFNIRYNTEHKHDELVTLIESVIKKHSSNYILQAKNSAEPFLSQESEIIKIFASSVKYVTNVVPSYTTGGGTSDARFLQAYCPVLEFGLLSDFAHKIDEYVEIGDLQRLYDVYYHTLCSIHTTQVV